MNTATLFSGQPLPHGGLSNEVELDRACPSTFREPGNPWTDYAGHVAFFPSDPTKWQWKSANPQLRERQLECFKSVLDGPHHDHLKRSVRSTIGGWMLSEMLEAVPGK